MIAGRIALLPGGSMTEKRIKIFKDIAHSLNMQVLDLKLLSTASEDQRERAVKKLTYVFTEETDTYKVAQVLGVDSIDYEKVKKPEYLSELKLGKKFQVQTEEVKDFVLQKKRSKPSSPVETQPVQQKQQKIWDGSQKVKNPDGIKSKFACFIGIKPEDESDYKNQIVEQLEKLMGMYESSNDKGKVMGYRRAISSIKAYKKPITEPKQMDEIPYVGDAIKSKVKELISEGKIGKLEMLKDDQKLIFLEQLTKIWGVGPVIAERLFSEFGIRSIEELQTRQDELLTTHQKIGLKYINDFAIKIPRDMVTLISKVVEDATFKLFGDKVKTETCGSYRRGRGYCGDVDILITRTDDKPVQGMIDPIVTYLEKIGFLYERLGSTRSSEKGSEMYMGVCKHTEDQYYRRIDIKAYPRSQYGFALLYFTGSDYFNRSMRKYAETIGYSLSDHGLTPVTKVNRRRVSKSQIGVCCETEQDVFEALGLPYKLPSERDI